MRKIALVFVSLVALTLLVGTALGLERTVSAWVVPPAEAIAPDRPPTRTPNPPRAAAAASTTEATRPTEQATPAPAPAEPAALVVPDLTRVRVDRAIRQMRELGLRLRVTDDYRAPVGRDLGTYYRIRPDSITPPPGTAVERGTVVRARAYELAEFGGFADGY